MRHVHVFRKTSRAQKRSLKHDNNEFNQLAQPYYLVVNNYREKFGLLRIVDMETKYFERSIALSSMAEHMNCMLKKCIRKNFHLFLADPEFCKPT